MAACSSPSANWTNGATTISVFVARAARKSELERDAEHRMAERSSQHQERASGTSSQAHPVEYLPDLHLQRRTDAQSFSATGRDRLIAGVGAVGSPNTFAAQLPICMAARCASNMARGLAYVQDEWKVSPTVTLSLGLRYDYLNQPKTLDGRLWNALDLPNKKWIIGASTMPGLCSVVKAAPCIPIRFRLIRTSMM
jgi:hypothetical protein